MKRTIKQLCLMVATVLVLTAAMCALPVGADETNLVINGNFSDGNSSWTVSNFTVTADGYAVLSDASATGYIQQFVNVPSDSTVRLSFKMKNSVADAVNLYYEVMSGAEATAYAPVAALRNTLQNNPLKFGVLQSGEDTLIWRNYSVDIPITVAKRTEPVQFRLRLIASPDTALCIDDIALMYINDNPNYLLNGGFEFGNIADGGNGWTFLNMPGSVETDSDGNHYFHSTSRAKNTCLRKPYLALDVGRYKLSFRVKAADTTKPLYLTLAKTTVLYTGTSYDGYLNGLYQSAAGVPVSCGADLTDDWETKTIYFTVPQMTASMDFSIPALGTASVTDYYLDDITLTKDETCIEFADNDAMTGYRGSGGVSYSAIQTKTGEDILSISETSTATIPVTAHFVPTKLPSSQNVTMVSAVYQTDANGIKTLVSISVKTGATIVSDATGGANANGLVCLQDSIAKPSNLSAAHTVEVMLWETLDTLTPYLAKKAVLAY